MVAIHVQAPSCSGLGQEITYTIVVENCSMMPAHHVGVHNKLPANAKYVRATPEPVTLDPEMRWQLGTLPPGGRYEICLVLIPTGSGDINNCARVRFEHGQCVCTRIEQRVGELGLNVRKQGPAQAALNDALSYRITVANTGDSLVTGVVVTDSIPAGLEHETRRNTLTWDMGDLAPGQSRFVDYQLTAKQSGRWCNAAVATAAGGLRHEVEHCVVVGEPKLTMAKTGPARRYLNMPAEYRLTVTNSGTLPLTNVIVADPVPAGMSFVEAKGGQLVENEVRWNIGALEPGASRSVEVALRAQQPGVIRNRATASAGNAKAEAEATTEFFGASALLLELVDTTDPVEVGGTTTYVIIVKNQGTIAVDDVRLTAQVPAELEVTQVTGPAKYKAEGQTLTFDPIALQPQAEVRIVVHVKANKPGDVRFKIELTTKSLTNGPIQEEESTTIFTDLGR